jgi:DNA-binding transcriptional MerR regulator
MVFSIGDFARHGQVSVRMLRYYDKLGLLRPAWVEPATGYRSYEAGQLCTLNRIVALKGLGLSLQQVGRILADDIGPGELRDMLRVRQAELAAQIEADTSRLAQVESRLRTIESVRVAEISARAAGFDPESITPVIRPLYEQLAAHLATAGIAVVAPAIAYYDHHDDGSVTVHAAMPVNAPPTGMEQFDIRDLPGVDAVATLVHRGPMEDVLSSVQQLARWVDGHRFRSAGPSREVYLDVSPGLSDFVTELQEPIVAA